MAVEILDDNLVGRTIGREFDGGMDVAESQSLLRLPNPTTIRKACRTAIAKGLAMVQCQRFFIGQSHGDGRGLFRA